MSDLLLIRTVPIPRKDFLALEFPVDPVTAPYLVSSSQGFVWVNHLATRTTVLAARQDIPKGDAYRMIVNLVSVRGEAEEWGNVLPLDGEGLHEALAWLLEQGEHTSEELELLVSPDRDRFSLLSTNFPGLDFVEADWLPTDQAVLLPKDRTFVGTLGGCPGGSRVIVVHNPSRSLVILQTRRA